MLTMPTFLPKCCHRQLLGLATLLALVSLLEVDHMTSKELGEATMEVVAISLWTCLVMLAVVIGIVVHNGIIVF